MNDIEVCPICREPYSERRPKVVYHLQYKPVGEYIHACKACNHAEWLSRQWNRQLVRPWQWGRIRLVRKFAKDNPHLTH